MCDGEGCDCQPWKTISDIKKELIESNPPTELENN